eukprot:7464260-Pyramimonas_sp.AAC.1
MLSPVRDFDPCMLHRAVWDSWMPQSMLSSVLEWTSRHVQSWAQVRGPISAAFMSLLRVGCAAASISTWINAATGAVYRPLGFSPWYTKQVVRKA